MEDKSATKIRSLNILSFKGGVTVMSMNRPGGELASRPLHFFFLIDSSGSMNMNGKIGVLNQAIREAIPHMQEVADENPNAEVLVRALQFSTTANWLISQPTPVRDFRWFDVKPDGTTAMGAALSLLADQLQIPPMSERALPPVIVLVSDGQSTDDFNTGVQKLLSLPWGKKAVRLAIAIGEDCDLDMLNRFINNPEIPPLVARHPESLIQYIKWASTAVVQAASAPPSQVGRETKSNVPLQMPVVVSSGDDDEVW